MTLTDVLDFGSKERVLPLGLYVYVKYESSITCHSKAMANVKVFAKKETDRWTNRQAKNYVPAIYGSGGIKRMEFIIGKRGNMYQNNFDLHSEYFIIDVWLFSGSSIEGTLIL